MKWYLIVGVVFLFAVKLQAHEIRPAYLQITQATENEYDVVWKVPGNGDYILKIYPEFDNGFTLSQSQLAKPVAGAFLNRFVLTGEKPLSGTNLKIVNLNKTMVDVLVTVSYLNGEKSTFVLHPDKASTVLDGTTSKWGVIKAYTVLGVEHIWFGIDHLLFVLALIIITSGFKKIVKTITAFTLAHSITLSLAVLGYANVPGAPVEAVIALSIVFLAFEMIKIANGETTLTAKKPWLVAFTFGLLHGFGFAGALSKVGLPTNEIPLALAFFNIGVEVGQIVFVLLVLVVLRFIAIKRDWPLVLKKAPAYAIGSVAAFWTIERVIGFWGS
ncbi:HupE/UreJ family protein [Neptunitalea lumnitzerae]|uniref:Membrane protein n=1 Tax=Neptunitalea lumnitzerae TaxID=2965509 RepID=A0ABQ5MEC7_9FLAO|nr:HupE/UreJ family protein [Neptunitalea sp. Y10]GLB47708.1 membrane protein [Neptunitalea sp. Y10]